MRDAPNSRGRHAAPWRGRRRVADAKRCFIAIRCTVHQRTAIEEGAGRAGLSIGAYLRALAFGNPGPRSVRRPPVERAELARLLGLLGKIGSNINQLAHGFNRNGWLPGYAQLIAIRQDVGQMRAALFKALGRGD
jgi:hypothetical protein